MSKEVYDKAMECCYEYWSREMLDYLYEKGKLTKEEYEDVIKAKEGKTN